MKPVTWLWVLALTFTHSGVVFLSVDLENAGQDHAWVSMVNLALGASVALGLGYHQIVSRRYWPVVFSGIAIGAIVPLVFPSTWTRLAAAILYIAVAAVVYRQSAKPRDTDAEVPVS